MSEPYEDDDPLALEWDRPRWTNRLTWVLLAAVVAALAFSGGLLIERQYDSTLLAGARGGARTAGGGLAVAGVGGARTGGGTKRGQPGRTAARRPTAQQAAARQAARLAARQAARLAARLAARQAAR